MTNSHNHNPDIDARELLARLQRADNLHLLDVREPIEYHTYNIGGTNVPLSQLTLSLSKLCWAANDEIIVICQAGIRSETAQSILQENGYMNVRNLTGGLLSLRKIQ